MTMYSPSDAETLGAIKTGYLLKCPRGQGRGIKIKFWVGAKPRFFVLRGDSLSYHLDDKVVDDPFTSKEVTLTKDSTVIFSSSSNNEYGFQVKSEEKVLQLVAETNHERWEWYDAISMVINQIKTTTRGYLYKLRAGSRIPSPIPSPQDTWTLSGPLRVGTGTFKGGVGSSEETENLGAGWVRKFFIIGEGRLTFHESQSQGQVTQGVFHLSPTTQVETRPDNVITIRKSSSKTKKDRGGWGDQLVVKGADADDTMRWVAAIAAAIARAPAPNEAGEGGSAAGVADDLAAESGPCGSGGISYPPQAFGESGRALGLQPGTDGSSETASSISTVAKTKRVVLRGDLLIRPLEGEGPWQAKHFVLKIGSLHVFEDRHHCLPTNAFTISPSCSVCETNLKPYSFEVVFCDRVVHLQGSSYEDSFRWITTLKEVINRSPQDERDPLLLAALKLEDRFYEVVFETKQPLGIVLERSKEWAIVKLANPELSSVVVGSAIASVNGKSVSLKSYHETIQLLSGWKPPLRLVFRSPPKKEGWLKRPRTSKKNKVDQDHCLSVVAGITAVTLQAQTHEEALSWAAHLHYSSALANGGGYMLDQERGVEKAYKAERARTLEKEATTHGSRKRREAKDKKSAAGMILEGHDAKNFNEDEIQGISGPNDSFSNPDGLPHSSSATPEVLGRTTRTSSLDIEPNGNGVTSASPGGLSTDKKREVPLPTQFAGSLHKRDSKKGTPVEEAGADREVDDREEEGAGMDRDGAGDKPSDERRVSTRKQKLHCNQQQSSGTDQERVLDFSTSESGSELVVAARCGPQVSPSSGLPPSQPTTGIAQGATDRSNADDPESTKVAWDHRAPPRKDWRSESPVRHRQPSTRISEALAAFSNQAWIPPALGPQSYVPATVTIEGDTSVPGGDATFPSAEASQTQPLRFGDSLGGGDPVPNVSETGIGGGAAVASNFRRQTGAQAMQIAGLGKTCQGDIRETVKPPLTADRSPGTTEGQEDESNSEQEEAGEGTGARMGVNRLQRDSHGKVELLTDEVLTKAFDSLDMATQSRRLNAMQFSSLWRVLSGEQNLFREMQMYQAFNTSGDTLIDVKEFKAGFRRLEQEKSEENAQILAKLVAWTEAQTVSF